MEKFQLKMCCLRISTKIYLWQKFPKWINLFCWKISTKIAFLKNFHKITHCWIIFTKNCFVAKFPQKRFFGQFWQKKKAMLDNYHKNKLPPSHTPASPPTPWKCPNSSWKKFLGKILKALVSIWPPTPPLVKKNHANLLWNGLPYK